MCVRACVCVSEAEVEAGRLRHGRVNQRLVQVQNKRHCRRDKMRVCERMSVRVCVCGREAGFFV